MVRRKQPRPHQDVGPPERRGVQRLLNLGSADQIAAAHTAESIEPAEESISLPHRKYAAVWSSLQGEYSIWIVASHRHMKLSCMQHADICVVLQQPLGREISRPAIGRPPLFSALTVGYSSSALQEVMEQGCA